MSISHSRETPSPDSFTTTVLDLPQLYARPTASELLQALHLLAIKPPSWIHDSSQQKNRALNPVSEEGIPRYLTGVVASKLSWVDEDRREEIWETASKRLSERAGRTAFPSVSRTFVIPNLSSKLPIGITLHEPSLNSDNLGHKTWVASYLLAKRLPILLPYLPSLNLPGRKSILEKSLGSLKLAPRILELGAGTGLVGIAAAALFSVHVHLTDLPAILPNLQANTSKNAGLLSGDDNGGGGELSSGVLDWSDLPPLEDGQNSLQRTEIILAADPLYSPLHPAWLVNAIERFLQKGKMARVVVELPLRDAYIPEVENFKNEMKARGFNLLMDGKEVGYDDWGGGCRDGLEQAEVTCWWGIWGWTWTLNA